MFKRTVMRLPTSLKVLMKSGTHTKQRQASDDTCIFSLSSYSMLYNAQFIVQKVHFCGQSIGTGCVMISWMTAKLLTLFLQSLQRGCILYKDMQSTTSGVKIVNLVLNYWMVPNPCDQCQITNWLLTFRPMFLLWLALIPRKTITMGKCSVKYPLHAGMEIKKKHGTK